MPAISAACENTVSQGRFSTISVLDLPLDEAELRHGQRDDDHHQHYRLRRGAAKVRRLHTVVVDLVDQDLRCARRAALRDGVDDAESLEERVHDVDHQEEEGGGREQREYDGPEAPARSRAIDGGGFDERARDGLQAGEEEKKVVADLLPGG